MDFALSRVVRLATCTFVAAGVATSVMGPEPALVGVLASLTVIVVAVVFRHLSAEPELGLIGLLVAAAIVSSTFTAIRLAPGLPPGDVAIVLSLVAALITRPQDVRLVSRPYAIAIPGLILIGGIASALAAGGREADLLAAVQFSYAYCLVPIAIGVLSLTRSGRVLAVGAFLSGVAVSVGVALWDVAGGDLSASLTGLVFYGRYAGLTTHPNTLGLLGVLGVPMAMSLIDGNSSRATRAMGLTSVLISVGAVALSGSRAAMIALPVALAAYWVFVNRFQGRVTTRVPLVSMAAALTLLALVVSHPGALAFSVDRFTGVVSVDDSDQARLLLYAAAWADFLASPILGVGFGGVRDAHDIYLQVLSSAGTVGFLLWVTYLAASLRLAVQESQRGRPLSDAHIAAACAAAICAWLVVGLFQNAVLDRNLLLPVGLLLGLAARREVLLPIGYRGVRGLRVGA
jgi:O-antigen ligase